MYQPNVKPCLTQHQPFQYFCIVVVVYLFQLGIYLLTNFQCPLSVAFVVLTSLISTMAASLLFPLLLWLAKTTFPFNFCHRLFPSCSKYTWMNIGPQMIIKTQQQQAACKIRATGTPQTSSPLCAPCFLDSHPVWKQRYQHGHTVYLFLFLKAAFLKCSSLTCVFVDLKMGWELMRKGKCVYEKYKCTKNLMH